MSEINWNHLNEIYKSAAPANGGMAPVPDGTYQTKVHSVSFKISKADNVYLFWVLEILEGVHAGRNLLKKNMLKTAKNMSHFKKDVAMCGVKPPDGIAIFSYGDRRNEFLKSLLDVGLVCRKITRKVDDGAFVDVWFESKWTPSKFQPSDPPTSTASSSTPISEPQSGAQNVENTFNDDDIPF